MKDSELAPLAAIERERHALRQITAGVPLAQVLDELLSAVDAQSHQNLRTSVLIKTEDGKHLRHGAGPNLPAAYNRAVDGIPISEGTGSCGTGAARGEPVFVTDIANDPLWKDYRELALDHDLRACWSTPVRAIDGEILGTFAIYYDTPRSPTSEDIQAIAQMTQTVALALERHRFDQKQKDIENELRKLNRNLEREVEARAKERDKSWNLSPDLLGVMNADLFLEATNPAWANVLGWSDWELRRNSITFFIHPDDVAAVEHAVRRLKEGNPIFHLEARLRSTQGSFRWMSWTGVPEGDRSYWTARDIQHEKDATDALENAEAIIRQTQKMDAVGQLSGGLAHDFNNLLAGVSGSLELMGRKLAKVGDPQNLQRYVGIAQDASRRAAALTQRLLAFSRRQTLAPKALNLHTVASDMAELIGRTIGPSIDLQVMGQEGLWRVAADPSQVENALLNLCINARDAMPTGGRIEIETCNVVADAKLAQSTGLKPGHYVSICVRDNGAGMTRDVLSRAFDPFFTTKPIGMGTGLGLSMVYGFARQSGGTTTLSSEPGNGTTVCIYLPRDATLPVEDAPPANAAVAVAERDATILLVDDEPTVRAFVAEALSDMGYKVVEAADGAEAMLFLHSGATIDLLVSDVGLPGGLNGRQVAEAFRVKYPGLKVLFITGYAESAVLQGGHLEPGMDVLTKPFHLDALSQRITSLANER